MLSLDGVRVQYGPITAIQNVNLHVNRGEIVALIGPNGAGKSTTLSAITGIVPFLAGEILFEGKPLRGRAPEDIVRRGISLVPEGRHIFADLTVEENLRLGAMSRSDRGGVARDLDEMLERFPILKKKLHASGGRLSGGEQQQLAIARALLSRPKLLLLDEPSLGLAPLVTDMVFEILEKLRIDGITILLVEQYASRAVELANRTYLLRNGRIELEGCREELLKTADFKALYFGIGR